MLRPFFGFNKNFSLDLPSIKFLPYFVILNSYCPSLIEKDLAFLFILGRGFVIWIIFNLLLIL